MFCVLHKLFKKRHLQVKEVDQRGEVSDVAAVVVIIGLLLLDGAAAPAGRLPGVSMADRRWWRVVVVVAVIEDDDAPSSRPWRRAVNCAKAAHWRSLSVCSQSSCAHL